MATSNSKFAYDDCYEILDRALESDKGVKITVDNDGEAYHLRNRLNYARNADRDFNRETYEVGHPLYGRSIYDGLTIKLRFQSPPCILVERIKLSRQIEEIK